MPIHRPAGKRRDRQIDQSLEGLNALLRNAATPDDIGHITEAVRLWLTRAEGEALRREREREYEGFEAGKTETVDVTFCPPSGEGKPLKTGGGGGLEAPEDTGRIQQLEAMLDAHGFAGSYDKKIGRCTGSGFDRFPYYLYTFVSGAQGQILVSPGSDSGTFLSDDIRPPEAYALPKEQLRKLPGIQFVRYDSADQWDATILGFLGTFYRDRESILKDLKSFAKVLNVSIGKLNISNMRTFTIRTNNGQTLTGAQYLSIAALAFGWAKGTKESYTLAGPALEELKRIASGIHTYNPRDALYYAKPDNIRHDLEAFASAVPCTVEELTAYGIRNITVKCGNGEQANGSRYLSEAGIAMGFAEREEDAQSKPTYLDALKEKAGYVIAKAPRMDRAYFTQAHVLQDLSAYAASASSASVTSLSTSAMSQTNVQCANGETVRGDTYILRAGVALGMAKNTSEAGSMRKAILDRLKAISAQTGAAQPLAPVSSDPEADRYQFHSKLQALARDDWDAAAAENE